MAIGQLRGRVRFEARTFVDDGLGNPQSGDFAEVYSCAARIMPKMGGETVLASRLSGVQPMLITVRCCQALKDIGTDWRIVDMRTSPAVYYDITAISNPDEKKQYLEILAVAGKAT